jgi:hypothetical protein
MDLNFARPRYNFSYEYGDNKTDYKIEICNHPEHEFPTLLFIPAGSSHTHTCPHCGQSATVYGSHQYLV